MILDGFKVEKVPNFDNCVSKSTKPVTSADVKGFVDLEKTFSQFGTFSTLKGYVQIQQNS